ncbi:hypothetical protein NB689_002177 [Xanthomonas sacchari]|nr:hypothetical protein [Xanthomonas sacchari]
MPAQHHARGQRQQHAQQHHRQAQQQRVLREVPARPGRQRQVTDIVGLVAGQAAHLALLQQHHAALKVLQRGRLQPGVEEVLDAGRVLGQQRDHAAPGLQRRLEAHQHHVAGCRLHRHLGGGRQVGAARIERQEAGQLVQHPVAHRKAPPAGAVADRQRRAPALEQRLRAQAAEHQQVAVGVLVDLGGVDQGHPQRRVAGGRAEPAEQGQQVGHVLVADLVRHHHGGLGQVGQAREREAGIAERGQVRHRHVVMERAQVHAGIGVDRTGHVGEGVLARLRLRAVEEEVETQLAVGRERPGRQQQFLLHRHRPLGREFVPPAQRQRLGIGVAVERQRGDEGIVDADVERRLVLRLRHRVAIAQVDRDAVALPHEQIRRQLQADPDQVGVVAADVQLRGLRDQIAEAHRLVARDPVGRVVGLARLRRLEFADARHRAVERRAQAQRGGGLLQVVVVAAQHQQQLAGGIARIGDHRQGRAGDLGQAGLGRGQFRRQRRGGGEQHRVAGGRHVADGHAERRAAVAGLRAEPGSDDAGTAQRGQVRALREHERQFQAARIALVVERHRQQRQVVAQHQRGGGQRQPRGRIDVGPQAGVVRILAIAGVVADQLQVEPVVVADQARIDRHVALLQLAGVLAADRQGRHGDAVDADLQVRQVRQQRRRVAVDQMQVRRLHHFVGAGAEGNAGAALDAAQGHLVVHAELLERGRALAFGRRRLRRGGRGGGGRRCGGRKGRLLGQGEAGEDRETARSQGG